MLSCVLKYSPNWIYVATFKKYWGWRIPLIFFLCYYEQNIISISQNLEAWSLHSMGSTLSDFFRSEERIRQQDKIDCSFPTSIL